MSDFEQIFKPLVEAWHSNACYPLAMTYEIDDIVEKAKQAAKQSMQGEAVAKIVYDRKTDEKGNTYHKSRPQIWPLIADAELLAYPHSTHLFTHAPDSAARIAEQDARISELEQQLEVARKDAEWQPIETAPKDGTHILLSGDGRVTEGKWLNDYYPKEAEFHSTGAYLGQFETGECIEGGWMSFDGGFTDEHPATHWKPLPAFHDSAIRQIGGEE